MVRLSEVLKFINRHIKTIFYVSWVILAAVSIYVAVLMSLSHTSVGDQTNISYMLAHWKFDGDLTFMAQHTNLMKLPLLWLHVNLLPYNLASYVSLNVVMVAATMIGWSWLVYRLIPRKSVAIALNMLLAGVLLGSTQLAHDLTMATIRNIEYPLVLLYVMELRKVLTQGISQKRWWIIPIIPALLIASDYFFLFTVVPAVILSIGWLFYQKRVSQRDAMFVSANVLVGALGGVILPKVLQVLDILSLIQSPRPFVSYDNFWSSVQNTLFQILKTFGGDFFGMFIRINSIARILLAGFAILAFCAMYKLWQEIAKRPASAVKKKAVQSQDFVTICLMIILIFTLGAYILSGFATQTGENNRYIAFLPFILATFVVVVMQKRHMLLLASLSVIVLGAGVLTSPENYRSYVFQKNQSHQFVELDDKIISYMKKHEVRTGYGSLGYSSTTWFLSNTTLDIYNIQPCNIKNPVLSTSRWYSKPNAGKTVLIVDRLPDESASAETWYGCSDQKIEQIYGKPIDRKVIATHQDKPVEIWLFNYDIGTRLVD